MNTKEITRGLTTIFSELVDGAPVGGAYVLNSGDPGLLASLEHVGAEAASRSRDGGATIAAHADHVRYGLSLMNRWVGGEENPFATADWGASWRISRVDEEEWAKIRAELKSEAQHWLQALGEPREVGGMALNGMIGSIAHLAYHLGAIRQIDAATRGPVEMG